VCPWAGNTIERSSSYSFKEGRAVIRSSLMVSIILITQFHAICHVLIQNSVTFPSSEFIHEVSSQQLHHLCPAMCMTCLAMVMMHTKEYVFFDTTRCFGTQILFTYYYKIDTNIRKHLLQCNRSVASIAYFYRIFLILYQNEVWLHCVLVHVELTVDKSHPQINQ
jgi:hypothetical protein